MLFEPSPMILNLNRKLLEEIEVFKPTKIVFNNLERAKEELIEVVGNFKIDTWNFTFAWWWHLFTRNVVWWGLMNFHVIIILRNRINKYEINNIWI